MGKRGDRETGSKTDVKRRVKEKRWEPFQKYKNVEDEHVMTDLPRDKKKFEIEYAN